MQRRVLAVLVYSIEVKPFESHGMCKLGYTETCIIKGCVYPRAKCVGVLDGVLENLRRFFFSYSPARHVLRGFVELGKISLHELNLW